mmetsp:Transcript_33532/g.56237  ORF Transcript_33532/g.56237 Transcript_33532/m.56237 type:complete len:317 (-) Transcript_33532:293-1243(-)
MEVGRQIWCFLGFAHEACAPHRHFEDFMSIDAEHIHCQFDYSRDDPHHHRHVQDSLHKKVSELREMLIPSDPKKLQAKFLVCGPHSLKLSMEKYLLDVFTEHFQEDPSSGSSSSPEECARAYYMRSVADGLIVYETFADVKQLHEPDHRVVSRIELAAHGHEAANPWLEIGGKVYDVTALRDTHPGGAKLLDAYAGGSATARFLMVEGHVSTPSVLASMESMLVGYLEKDDGISKFRSQLGTLAMTLALAENRIHFDYAVVEDVDFPATMKAFGAQKRQLRYLQSLLMEIEQPGSEIPQHIRQQLRDYIDSSIRRG